MKKKIQEMIKTRNLGSVGTSVYYMSQIPRNDKNSKLGKYGNISILYVSDLAG